MYRTKVPILLFTCLCAACDPAGSEGADLGAPDLAAPLADLRPQQGDMAGCSLPYESRLIDEVSAGKIEVTSEPGPPIVQTATVDGTAGGAMAASSKPYIYLDLVRGVKVDITDVKAQTSRDWDIAIKRWQIKVNSGDSGPGGVTVARIAATDLGEVTSAPTTGYVEDEYLDESCQVSLDAIGGLATALSDWYDYAMTRLTPKKEVYVLKRRDGQGSIKLQIVTYYSMAGTSASYTLRWGLLP